MLEHRGPDRAAAARFLPRFWASGGCGSARSHRSPSPPPVTGVTTWSRPCSCATGRCAGRPRDGVGWGTTPPRPVPAPHPRAVRPIWCTAPRRAA
ncbi:hypothetical protein QJS66_06565 [Kocuria rhizophila]|nr:hypothetical protein QJS66_06565 [Kocuria rhizophila]